MNSYGLKEILAAAISGAEEFCVRPDFGVKGGAAGVEYADDLPLYRAERDHIADRQAGVALGGVFSDDNFSDPRREHPSFGDLDAAANFEHIFRDAAKLNVGIRARRNQGNWSDDNDFRRDQRALDRKS